MHLIITRQAALAAGLTRYFTGKPCIRGHVDQRLVSTKSCRTCNRQVVREWVKTPRGQEARRHRERNRRRKAREAGRKYYFTGKPCKRGHIDRRFVSSHLCVTCCREKAFEHFWSLTPEKREARRAYERQRWQDPAHRRRMREYQRQPAELEKQRRRNRPWKRANRARCTDRQNKRNALLYAVFVEEVSLAFLFTRDKGCCQLCGAVLSLATPWPDPKTPTRDHIVPLTKGGTHERANLQLACAECNIRKGNRCA